MVVIQMCGDIYFILSIDTSTVHTDVKLVVKRATFSSVFRTLLQIL